MKRGGHAVAPCIVGWQIPINSLIAVWKDLQNNGFKYLLTNRLNQDCLKNLFLILRSKGGSRDNPNPQQFRTAFRHATINKFFVLRTSAYCALDADKILLDISNVSIQQEKTEETPKTTAVLEPVAMAMPPLSMPKKNVVAYMVEICIR